MIVILGSFRAWARYEYAKQQLWDKKKETLQQANRIMLLIGQHESFTEAERYEGKKGNEEFMLQRYWNKNPIMKDIYSNAIIDTIDMFEDIQS